MTNTYLQPEVHIVITQQPGVDGVPSTAQIAQIESDLALLLARPAITSFDDIPGVTMTAPSTGQVLTIDAGGEIVNSSASFGTISVVRDDTTTLASQSNLWFRQGLSIDSNPSFPTTAYISPVYGTTANTVAAGNHQHPTYNDLVLTFAASGTLSSGTRTLVSGNVTGLDPARSYRLRGTLLVHARGDGAGASFALTRVTINGVNKNNFEDSRLVAGVLVTETNLAPTAGTITGVSSVAVSASVTFQSGDPSYIGGGVLVIEIEANR